MNVQNAKELTITEGDVRTIHDSNGKQLWGMVAYDTKYAGDTTQATYSGKNLQPLFADGSITSSQTMTAGRLTLTQFYSEYNQTLTANGGTLSSTSTGTSIWKMTFTGLTPSTQYTISADFEIALNGTDKKFFALGNYRYNQPDTVTGRFAHTFTTDESGGWVSSSSTNESLFYLYNNSSCTVSNIQLETGATATDYQQYVGGVPSPNPEFPQPIEVVTGTQTITLTDGVVSDDFTVDLGSIELAKIGTYQDYIYKSGDDWYVHKATEKMTLNGTENWSSGGSGTQVRFFITLNDIALQAYDWNASIVTVSNAFIGTNWFQFYNTAIDNAMCSHDSSHYLMVRATQFNDTSAFKTWLQSNNTTVYYALATPTDTQITDATLISQLEAIHGWLTRYGYQSSVVGSLPIIISQTNL